MQKIEQWLEGQPRFFLLLLSCFLFLCGLFFWIGEDYRHWQGLIEEGRLLRKEFEAQKQQLVDLNNAQNQIKILQSEWLKTKKSFPSQNESSSLLEEMTSLGHHLGLNFRAFSPEAQERRFHYLILPIQVDLAGTYHQLYAFLEKVAQLKYFVLVDEMHLKRKHKSLQAHLLIKIYWYPKNELD